MRLLLSFVALQFSAALCAAQSPNPPVDGVEAPVLVLHSIALDMDQQRDPLYCYFGTRVITPAVRVRVDSVARVAAADECNGVGLGFVMRTTDRTLLVQMLKGVIQNNPRFDVVSAFFATVDINRNGDIVRVARTVSILRGVSTTVSEDGGRTTPRDRTVR